MSLARTLAQQQRQLAALQQQLRELSDDRDRLAVQHTLLSSCCGFLQQLTGAEGDADSDGDGDECAASGTSAAELQLLRQLDALQGSLHRSGGLPCQREVDSSGSSNTGPPAAWQVPPGASTNAHSPIAPHDPLLLVRHTCQLERHPDAASITLEEVCHAARAVRQRFADALARLEAADAQHSDGAATHPLQEIQQQLLRHQHLLFSLVASGRGDLVRQATLCDLVTGEQLQEPDAARHAWALQQVQLSEQQRRRMAAGSALFQRLQLPVLQERLQLQRQLQRASGNNALAPIERQAAEEAARRLQQVLGKEMFLSVCSSSFIACTLTWAQFARLGVLVPSPVSFATLGRIISSGEDAVTAAQAPPRCER